MLLFRYSKYANKPSLCPLLCEGLLVYNITEESGKDLLHSFKTPFFAVSCDNGTKRDRSKAVLFRTKTVDPENPRPDYLPRLLALALVGLSSSS